MCLRTLIFSTIKSVKAMIKKININDIDFEAYLDNALKSYGYLFPLTDEQMSVFEENMENIPLPENLESAKCIFEGKKRKMPPVTVIINNTEGERNWAIAAREGKEIPEDILAKMKKDKEEAKKKQNGNK